MAGTIPLLLDEHLRPGVARALREQGVDALHVQDLNLKGSTDLGLLHATHDLGRTLVTRDIDFVRLSDLQGGGVLRPYGLLLVPAGIPDEAPGLLIAAITDWVASVESGAAWWQPGSVAWLRPPAYGREGADGRVRERRPPYARALKGDRVWPVPH